MMGEWYVKSEYWIAVFQLVFAMLGMGATLTVKDFYEVVVEPLAISVGTVIQLAVVPITAFLFLRLLGIEGGLAVGIALVAAIPGGTISNIFTYLAHGNAALSISITAVTTLVCLVSTPLILALMIGEYLPADFTMPKAQIMKEIALTLLLPLSIGMLYLHFLPKSAPTLSKWSIRASLLGILAIVVGSAMSGRLNVAAFGYGNVLLIALFVFVLAVVPGYLIPRLARLSRADCTAILCEVSLRNVNLGVLIKASIFPAAVAETAQLGNAVLLTLVAYGVFQLVVGVAVIAVNRRAPSAQ
jgi:bile acid:Na+ symporter, BASS family